MPCSTISFCSASMYLLSPRSACNNISNNVASPLVFKNSQRRTKSALPAGVFRDRYQLKRRSGSSSCQRRADTLYGLHRPLEQSKDHTALKSAHIRISISKTAAKIDQGVGFKTLYMHGRRISAVTSYADKPPDWVCSMSASKAPPALIAVCQSSSW